jgi:hypothetical protein
MASGLALPVVFAVLSVPIGGRALTRHSLVSKGALTLKRFEAL